MPRDLDRLRRTEQFRRNLRVFPHVVEVFWDAPRLTPAYQDRCHAAHQWARERYGAHQPYYDVGGLTQTWTRLETVFMFADPDAALEFTLRWR